MNARVGTGGTRQFELPAEKDRQGLLHLFLDGAGIVLDLESAVVGPFIGYFQKISGHLCWVCDERARFILVLPGPGRGQR